jgi:hypothetical protein
MKDSQKCLGSLIPDTVDSHAWMKLVIKEFQKLLSDEAI